MRAMSEGAPGYDSDNVFARILRDEIPSDRVYEDDEFIAFRDINPAAPTHIVLIPRGEPPAGPGGLEDGDAGWAGRMLVAASRIAEQQRGWQRAATGWSSTAAPTPGRKCRTSTCTSSAAARSARSPEPPHGSHRGASKLTGPPGEAWARVIWCRRGVGP